MKLKAFMIGLVLMISAVFSMPALADMHIPIASEYHEAVDPAVQIPLADVADLAVSGKIAAAENHAPAADGGIARSHAVAAADHYISSTLLASAGPGDDDEDPGNDIRVIRT